MTLTDRVDPKLVYLSAVAATIAGHFLFGVFADGFWSAMSARALTGVGWAGTYMTGLKLLADLGSERRHVARHLGRGVLAPRFALGDGAGDILATATSRTRR